MGKILNTIQRPVVMREEIVEHKGETYVLTGSPDANLLGRTVYMTPDQRATRAAHWENVTGSEFDAEVVGQVMLVTECLQHEDDPALRYDETEIAKLALRDGPLFAMLYLAACKCVGFDIDPVKAIAEAAAPN